MSSWAARVAAAATDSGKGKQKASAKQQQAGKSSSSSSTKPPGRSSSSFSSVHQQRQQPKNRSERARGRNVEANTDANTGQQQHKQKQKPKQQEKPKPKPKLQQQQLTGKAEVAPRKNEGGFVSKQKKTNGATHKAGAEEGVDGGSSSGQHVPPQSAQSAATATANSKAKNVTNSRTKVPGKSLESNNRPSRQLSADAKVEKDAAPKTVATPATISSSSAGIKKPFSWGAPAPGPTVSLTAVMASEARGRSEKQKTTTGNAPGSPTSDSAKSDSKHKSSSNHGRRRRSGGKGNAHANGSGPKRSQNSAHAKNRDGVPSTSSNRNRGGTRPFQGKPENRAKGQRQRNQDIAPQIHSQAQASENSHFNQHKASARSRNDHGSGGLHRRTAQHFHNQPTRDSRGQGRKKNKNRYTGSNGGRYNSYNQHGRRNRLNKANMQNPRYNHINLQGQSYGYPPLPPPPAYGIQGPQAYFPQPYMVPPSFYPSPMQMNGVMMPPAPYGYPYQMMGPTGPLPQGMVPGMHPAAHIPAPHMPSSGAPAPLPAPARVREMLEKMKSAGPDEKIYGVDVECVATGVLHTDRTVARIVLVNLECEIVFDEFVQPCVPVFSCITPLTGVTKQDLEEANPIEKVQARLREVIGPDAILVGQSLHHDIEWAGLQKGKDFKDQIDIALLFRSPITRRDGTLGFIHHSLKHECKYLLHMDIQADKHDPSEDARSAILLFKKFRNSPPQQIVVCQNVLLRSPRTPSFSQLNKIVDGVSMSRESNSRAQAILLQKQQESNMANTTEARDEKHSGSHNKSGPEPEPEPEPNAAQARIAFLVSNNWESSKYHSERVIATECSQQGQELRTLNVAVIGTDHIYKAPATALIEKVTQLQTSAGRPMHLAAFMYQNHSRLQGVPYIAKQLAFLDFVAENSLTVHVAHPTIREMLHTGRFIPREIHGADGNFLDEIGTTRGEVAYLLEQGYQWNRGTKCLQKFTEASVASR